MKPDRLFTALAISAMTLLAAIAYVKRPAASPPVSPQEVETPRAPASAVASVRGKEPPSATIPATMEKQKPFTWHQVESPEYKQYISNLRAIGCPEQTIRDIIVADVNKLYAARENPLRTAIADASKQPEKTAGGTEMENRRKLREVQVEKRAVLKELLGIDTPLDLLPAAGSRSFENFEAALAALPPGKRDAVQALQESFWQQSDAIKAKHKNKRTPEYLAEHRALTETTRQEMGKLLTTSELEDYEIRTSTTGAGLAKKTALFSPSEEEFRKIFRATQEFENQSSLLAERLAGGGGAAAAQEKADTVQRLSTELNASLKTALGEERFNEYQRAQDANYQNLVRVGQRYGLEQDVVLRAYELEKAIQSRTQPRDPGALASEPGQSAEARQWSDQLFALLGEKAAKAYRQVRTKSAGKSPEP